MCFLSKDYRQTNLTDGQTTYPPVAQDPKGSLQTIRYSNKFKMHVPYVNYNLQRLKFMALLSVELWIRFQCLK